MHGLESLAMGEAHLIQGFAAILESMKAVGDLGGRRRPWLCTLGIRGRAIARAHLHPRMLLEPLRHRRGRPSREQCHGLAARQINEHGALGLAFPQREVIHAEDRGRGERRSRRSSVFRRTARSHAWPRRTPAVPPRATPRATRRWASRMVRRAQGAATVGRRSVKMRRRQWGLRQNHVRPRSWSCTRHGAQGRSARVRS
jgi:hypothetical protein